MGYTKGQFVQSALAELGLAESEYDLTTEELASGASRLDAMIAAWSDRNIRLSYNSSGNLDDDSGIPSVANEAVITNLAVRLASSYGKQVPIQVRSVAKESLTSLMRFSTSPRERQFPSMPRGAGYKNRLDRFTPPPEDEYLGDVDDSVDTSGGPSGT